MPQRTSLKDKAYRYIQSRIATGRLSAGDPVSELAIARGTGISRTPIREALGQLAAEGFLEQAPGRGATVRRLTRLDIVELYELREALEVFAVGKVAAAGLAEADRRVLRQLCASLLDLAQALKRSARGSLSPAGMRRFVPLDLNFHLVLLRAAGNERLLKVVSDLRLLIRIFALRRDGHSYEQLRQIHAFHRSILAAVEAGDPTRAQQLVGEHIQLSRQERLDHFDRAQQAARIEEAFPLARLPRSRARQ